MIFPGVGEASSAMKKLKEKRFRYNNSEFKTTCFGNLSRMQLMCNASEEGNTKALGFLIAKKIVPNSDIVPHMGLE